MGIQSSSENKQNFQAGQDAGEKSVSRGHGPEWTVGFCSMESLVLIPPRHPPCLAGELLGSHVIRGDRTASHDLCNETPISDDPIAHFLPPSLTLGGPDWTAPNRLSRRRGGVRGWVRPGRDTMLGGSVKAMTWLLIRRQGPS